MSRENHPKTIQIGSITVLAENLLVARQVADIVNAMPKDTRPLEGSVQIDGQKIKWYCLANVVQAKKGSQSR